MQSYELLLVCKMLFPTIFVLIAAGFQCLAWRVVLGVNTDLGPSVGLGIQDQSSVGLTLGTDVGVDTDLELAVDFKLRLLAGLKAAGIFEGYSGTINENQLSVVSTLLVQLLSTRFSLQLGNSYIESCYKALSAVNVSLDLDAYLSVLADFTTQLLVQQGVLTDLDAALRTSCESIILTCSRAFNLNIDLNAAVKLALSVVYEIGANKEVGDSLRHGGSVVAGSGLDDDVSVKIAKKFGCIIKTSADFDLAVLSGERKSVLRAIVPAIRGSLGIKAANAFAHCIGVGLGLGIGL